MIVLNFSHPLSEEAVRKLSELIGAPAEVIQIKVQVNRWLPLIPQVNAVYQASLEQLREHSGVVRAHDIDYIILPGLADVAVLLARRFMYASVVSLAAVPDVVPQKFMPVEIIAWSS